MRPSTTRVRDQRRTDRTFRQLTRQLRPHRPTVQRWRSSRPDGRDVHIGPHGDRRSVPVIAATAGSLVIAIAAVLTGQADLAVTMSLVGLAGCALLGADHARTYLTITEGGRVEVGNGVHRRTISVPAVAVARVAVPVVRSSRWDPRRAPGHLHLHNGDRIPVRALAFDVSRELDHERAVRLARATVRAFADAGAVLETTKV